MTAMTSLGKNANRWVPHLSKLKMPWLFCQPENFTFLTFENKTEKIKFRVTDELRRNHSQDPEELQRSGGLRN